MIEIAFIAVYLVCCLVWFPILQAITMWLIVYGCFMGVITLTRTDGLVPALRWLGRHPFRAAFILAGTAIPTLAAIQDHRYSAAQIALNWMLFFMWFWLGAAWGARKQADSNGEPPA
jgi:hypothetical protein